MLMKEDYFVVDLRDVNGKWYQITGDRQQVYEYIVKLEEDIENDEVMMVRVNDSVLWSSLASETLLETGDLIGFFA